MFYVIREGADEKLVVGSTSDPDELHGLVAELRRPGCRLIVAEFLYAEDDVAPTGRLPRELERAIAAWNAMTCVQQRRVPRVADGRKFLTKYRTWKRKNPKRTYLLESAMPFIERSTFVQTFVTFGWLLTEKDGTPNMEKLRNGRLDDRSQQRHDSSLGTRDDEFSPTTR